jgi:hypothetical protein
MLTIEPRTPDNVVVGHASGKLTHEDYEIFRWHIEEMIREHGSVRVMLELEDFHGWDFQSAWDDLKLGLSHPGKFDRCAVLGDQSWQRWMTELAKPFLTVRFFNRGAREAAWRWLMLPAEQAGEGRILDAVGGTIRRHPAASMLVAGVIAGLMLGRMRRSRPVI